MRSLAFVDPVVIGILIGLVLGAVGAWLALRATDPRASLETTMKALASDALASSNRTFLDLARSQLEQLQQKTTQDLDQRKQAVEHLVAPIKESLSKVDGKLQELELARTRAYTDLSTQVRVLAEGQKDLRSETGNLVSALRDRPNVRGRWGEIQLRRVVEMAGMLEHCDFETQHHVSTEEGRLRPDLVVKLPGGKTVVLFMPGETFLSAALEQDPSLIEDGVNQQVIIATPTTLIALLRAVAYGWRQETIAESAKAISELGRELYTRLATLTDHFAKVGRGLETAVRSYNETVGSLETRVLPSARKFREQGISPASELTELPAVDRSVRTI